MFAVIQINFPPLCMWYCGEVGGRACVCAESGRAARPFDTCRFRRVWLCMSYWGGRCVCTGFVFEETNLRGSRPSDLFGHCKCIARNRTPPPRPNRKKERTMPRKSKENDDDVYRYYIGERLRAN